MAKDGTSSSTAVPRLRFPEFRKAGDWKSEPLGTLSKLIKDRAGDKECTPYTVTTGVGLVSQQQRYGRTIAGDSIKNYLLIRRDDFAYNKSATKLFPQGYIARYLNDGEGAVPSSIFTCFRTDSTAIVPAYIDYLFASNLHGTWLDNFITVGARANGALQVNNDDLLSLPVPLPDGPSALAEQQKIADCLTSLDAVIAAQGRKVAALANHKRGLMQQLFPREGETLPRLRFPKFRGEPEWDEGTVGSRCKSFSGGTPETTNKTYYGGAIPFIRSAEIGKNKTELFLTEDGLESSAAKLVDSGDVLVALYGANSGDVALARISGAINQAILCLRPDGDKAFMYHFLTERKSWILATYIQGGQGNLSGEIIRSVAVRFPSLAEQQRIAACLSALDAQIAAESAKRDVLKTHKQALMQQLFPSAAGA